MNHMWMLNEKSNNHAVPPFITFTSPTVSVVVPTLNEAENLPHVLPRIPSWVDEILLVDGRSTDNTIEVAKKLIPDIRIVKQTGKGKGDALRCGFEAATGDIIVMIDADGSTLPEEIPNYVGALLAGADYAKGSRFCQGGGTVDMPLYRRLGNMAFILLVRLLFGGSYSDLCYGYNAFWARVLPLLDLDTDGFEIETLMNVRALHAGLKVVEVPSFEADRLHGLSNLRTIPDGFRVLTTIIKEYFHRPGLRGVHVEKMPEQNDAFWSSIRLLLNEANQLRHQRDQLSDEAYMRAIESIKSAYVSILALETDSPRAKKLQKRYSKYFETDKLWDFLDETLSSKPEEFVEVLENQTAPAPTAQMLAQKS